MNTHSFEANPGLYDTSERFCAACGIAESAVAHRYKCPAWRIGRTRRGSCNCGGYRTTCPTLDRRVVEMLERLLHGEHALPAHPSAQSMERVERFEGECRALLAEMKEAGRG